MGVLHEGEVCRAQALSSLDVAIEKVRKQIESIVGPGEEETGSEMPFAPSSHRALEFALREAHRLGRECVATEHVLLGIVDGSDSVAIRVLSNFGINPEEIRRETVERAAAGGWRRE